MKYYINRERETLLIDENDYTPYLADRGYEEITKEEYDQKSEEFAEKYRKSHLDELELELRKIEEEEEGGEE